MNAVRKILGAWALLFALVVAGQAGATTWTKVSDFTPSSCPISAASSPGPFASSGWIDYNGNVWACLSGNLLSPSGQPNPSTSLNYQLYDLDRPASEKSTDAQVDVRFTWTSTSLVPVFVELGATRTSGNVQAYVIGITSTNTIVLFYVNGSSVTSLGTHSISLTSGTNYVFRVSRVQTNSTTTTLTSGVYDATGTTPQTTIYTNTDTTAAIQNVPGVSAVYENLDSGASGPLGINEIITYTDAGAASALTMSGPSAGNQGVASTPFSVSANGTLTSSVTITPSDGGGGGTFSPSTITLAPNATTASFTYTAASTAPVTISLTNSGTLTNPSSIAYTPTYIVPVSSTAFEYSPLNWVGDSSTCPAGSIAAYRCGSSYRQAWYPGAWFNFVINASSSPTASIVLPNSALSTVQVCVYVNNGYQSCQYPSGNITITGLVPNQTNMIRVTNNGSNLEPSGGKWAYNGTNVFQFTGVQVDGNSNVGIAPALRPWWLIIGDSITQGYEAGISGASVDSNLNTYDAIIGKALDNLGYDYAVSACGTNGWITPGDTSGDVPAYYYVSSGVYNDSLSRWNKLDSRTSALDSGGYLSAYGYTNTTSGQSNSEPYGIIINLITNEANHAKSPPDTEASIYQALTALRKAAPNAYIIVLMPFGLESQFATNSNGATYASYAPYLRTGVANYLAVNPADTKVKLADYGTNLSQLIQSTGYINASDQLHPTIMGQAAAAPYVMQTITSTVSQSAPAPSIGNSVINVP